MASRALILLTLALAVTTSAAAAPRTTCTVTPDPVSLTTDLTYTVTATGAAPLDYYEIIIRQRHDGDTDERRDALVQADADGNVTWTFQVSPVPPEGLLVGDAKVYVSRYRTGGGPGGAASTISYCEFTVTP